MNLYPSILTGSIAEAQKEVMWVASYEKIRTVQVDVIDGLFVDNVTITPTDLLEVDFAELSIDFHLLTEEPLDYVYEAIEHEKSLPIRAIIAQVERMGNQEDYLDIVKKHNWQRGLSLDLYTPFDAIDGASWPELDIVQLMGIEAGFQGKEFSDSVLEKIKSLIAIREKLERNFEIIIDGGVKPDVVKQIEAAGADSVIVGSGLWQSEDLDGAVSTYTSA